MIVTAMIMAIQRLRNMTQGGGSAGKLARWTVGYYVLTTILAVAHSALLVGLVWSKLFNTVSGSALAVSEEDQELIDERKDTAIHDVVVDMFYSLVPQNIVDALASDALLSVLITSIVLGYVIKPGGAIYRAVEEVEVIVLKVITVLIHLAPIGVFFLIMPNLFRLDIAEIGANLGILIGGTLCGMFIHLFIIIPFIFVCITRSNPYTYWMKMSPAWITAWGTASSAGTLPVTIRCVLKQGIPVTGQYCIVHVHCHLLTLDSHQICRSARLLDQHGWYRNLLPDRSRLPCRYSRHRIERRRLHHRHLALDPRFDWNDTYPKFQFGSCCYDCVKCRCTDHRNVRRRHRY